MLKLSNRATYLLAKRTNARFATFAKYPFLAELGLKELNQGAYYDGKWQTTESNHVFQSINPSDEQVIASTQTASLKDYEKAISLMG
jgi:hypothetical protein